MSAEQTPPVFDDPAAAPELRQFAELARSDGPSQAELERLAARVEAATGVAVAAPPRPAAELGTAPEHVGPGYDFVLTSFGKRTFETLLSSTATKWIAALGLSAGLGVGAWSVHLEQTGAPRSSATSAESPARPPPSAESGREEAPRLASDTKVVEPLAPAGTSGQGVANEARPRERPLLRREVQRAARPGDESLRGGSLAKPSELSLIRQAEAARADSARALDLLQEHARLYPAGALAQEREALAIELLLRTGELARASSRAGRFAAQHPGSAHLPRLRALLERARDE